KEKSVQYTVTLNEKSHIVDLSYQRLFEFLFDSYENIIIQHKQLKELEERYKNLFEESKSIMLLIDPVTADIIDANNRACSFYGYPRNQITTMKISDINTLPRSELYNMMNGAASNQTERFEFKHRLSDGELRDVEVYSGPIFTRGKNHLFSIIHDITERKSLEVQLLE
ncbi:MAG: PAS domain S-box protein, partial [Nitrospirae bacterium]|nr:PAS domain S-box protein [Nitrospirota bacterium]